MMFFFLKMYVKILQYGYKTIWTNVLRQMKLLGLPVSNKVPKMYKPLKASPFLCV